MVSEPNRASSINASAFIPQLHLLSRGTTICQRRGGHLNGGWLSLKQRVADISGSVHTPQLRRALPRPSDTHKCRALARARFYPRRGHAPHFGVSFTEQVSSGGQA